MSLLTILHYPDPRLRIKAQPVMEVDDTLRRLVDDMFDTMYDAPGIGLAAPQINISRRVVVIDVSLDNSTPLCLINPEILSRDGVVETEEGCLSVPEVYDLVERANQVRVRALDRAGLSFELDAEGLLAVCIQHEIDHLNGKLFVDYLSPLKKQRLQKRAEKQLRWEKSPRL